MTECRVGYSDRQFTRVGLRLLPAAALLFATATLSAQAVSPRVRGAQSHGTATPPPTPQPPVPVTPQQPPPPTSLLQQPAQPAQVTLSAQHLSIHADNSSLSAILHDISNISGMKIEGFGGDERVFGTFGPGAPRDVIADLLNGTAYNVVLLGDMSNGAPRELILTPASHGGAAAPAQGQAAPTNNDESEPEPEPQPEPPPDQPVNPQQPPGSVRTPQQLFEQLQRMRQNQSQQPSDQQQQQQQPTPPQQQ